MKILIIGPSWVGDMVMSQSLYITLKKQYPEARIDVLAPAWCKAIIEKMPEINSAIEMPIGHGAFDLKQRWKIGRKLKREKYDQAFVLPNSAKSALIPLFARIPMRTGWKGESRYFLLNDLRPNKRVFQYMVERYVALAHSNNNMLDNVTLQSCPYPKLTVSKENQKFAIDRLGLNTEGKIYGLCPGAEFGPSKRWPENYYAEITEMLISKGHQVWLFGSQKDNEVTEHIRNRISEKNQYNCYNLAGKTSLNEAVDLLAACHTVVCNDSGLMHVSAAVNCNIVALYGSTSPEYTPPLTKKLRILHTDHNCRPCFKRECPLGHLDCLKTLSPTEVFKAIET